MKTFGMVMITVACIMSVAIAVAEEKQLRATVDSDGIQRVDILGGGYFFRPNHIIVKVNVPVELKVRKESGWVPHNIVMNSPEAGMVFDVALSEEPRLVRFTPTKTERPSARVAMEDSV